VSGKGRRILLLLLAVSADVAGGKVIHGVLLVRSDLLYLLACRVELWSFPLLGYLSGWPATSSSSFLDFFPAWRRRICFLRWIGVFLFLRWQKEEDGRHKKEGVSPLRLQECWPPFSGLLFSSLLPGVCLYTPSVCLCGLLYKTSYMSGVENLDYTRPLDDQVVFQCACNLMMYSAMV